jgi:hypothetical protein
LKSIDKIKDVKTTGRHSGVTSQAPPRKTTTAPDESSVISVRVPRELLTRFDRIAETQRRKRGDLARIVLEDWTSSQTAAQEQKTGKK